MSALKIFSIIVKKYYSINIFYENIVNHFFQD